MGWYDWFTSAAILVCLAGLAFHGVRLLRRGIPGDFARPRGEVRPAIVYSFTGAMDPRKKESAYLHLPTYAAGLIYHNGTFLALLLFLLLFFLDIRPAGFWMWASVVILAASGVSGTAILVKRIVIGKLRALSVPDDFISNILLSVFHLLTVRVMVDPAAGPLYTVWAGLLFLYMPLGKLRHFLYFFAARIRAGTFYGSRGVWPAARH